MGQHDRDRAQPAPARAAHRVRARDHDLPHRARRSTCSATSCAAGSTCGRAGCERRGRGRPGGQRARGRARAPARGRRREDALRHRPRPRARGRRRDFSLERGRTLGIVGESGSGKTVLSRSIMGLLPKRGVVRHGSIRFEGEEIGDLAPKAMRRYWGSSMAMVFQDPMTSLNPVMKIGHQITESIHTHLDVTRYVRRRARGVAPRRRCASPIPSAAWTSTRTSSPAVCASACASRSRSPPGRSCSSPTSPPPRSTSPCRPRCSTSSRRSSASASWRWCSSPTTSAWSPVAPTT